MINSTKDKSVKTIASLKEYSNRAMKSNPWFVKAAKRLCLNSKVNVQKSYWKLKDNVVASGQVLNANIRIKLTKLISIVNRHTEINRWKSFYHILNYGKADHDRMSVSHIVKEKMDNRP